MMSETDLKRRYLIIYRKAMEEAYLENPNTLYDHPVLKDLRKSLHISRDEHDQVEKRVKVRLKVNEIDGENFTGRLDYFNKILSKDKQNVDAWVGKGEALYNLGQDERAIQCFDKANKYNPDFEEAWYFKGLSMTELSRLEDAIDCFDRAIQLYPEYKEAWLSSSIALNKRGENKKALACVNKALELDPKYLPSIVGQLIILLDLHECESALENADVALTLFPNNEQIVALKREAQRGMGVPEDQMEPENISYALPEDVHEKEAMTMGQPVPDGQIPVHDDEVITDQVFEAETENISVMEMVPEGKGEGLQELEVIDEAAIYENEVQNPDGERQDVAPVEIELTPLPDEDEVIKLEPIGVTEEGAQTTRPGQAERSSGEAGPGQAGPGTPDGKSEGHAGRKGEAGPDEKEEMVEELVELKPLELEKLSAGDTTFEESDKMVEEILGEMGQVPEAAQEPVEEAVVKEKENLDISDSEPVGDFKESDTVFKSTFDSYEFKVPDREEALIECSSCGDLIPFDSKICPLCDFDLGASAPVAKPEKRVEPLLQIPKAAEQLPVDPRPRPPRVRHDRPNLVQLHEARKKREGPKNFKAKRLFAGIQRVNKLVKCPRCGSPVAVPSSVRPIVVACTGCGSFGRLK